jgi:hypothetical protein
MRSEGAALTVSVLLFIPPLQPGMQLDIVGKFQNADLELDVAIVFRLGS